MSERVHIASAQGEALIDPLGAELVDWRVGRSRLLWRPDPAIWDKTSPILFPIVGRMRDGRYRVGPRWYELGTHGFAAGSAFELAARTQDSARFVLRDSEATRAVYPFPFCLTVDYRIEGSEIEVAMTVENTGDAPLPYAAGWHPGFALPFSDTGRGIMRREGHVVEFEREEARDVPQITSAGLFATARRELPFDGRRLEITDELMAREALCFLDANSRSVTLKAPDGAAISVEVDNFPHLALWSRNAGPFLCIEAWTGHGDPDGYEGDIFAKPSMRLLPAGETARHVARAKFEPAA
ncbi:MAG: aldose 1-epimerase family protein [Mesorhizobium sp.]